MGGEGGGDGDGRGRGKGDGDGEEGWGRRGLEGEEGLGGGGDGRGGGRVNGKRIKRRGKVQGFACIIDSK